MLDFQGAAGRDLCFSFAITIVKCPRQGLTQVFVPTATVAGEQIALPPEARSLSVARRGLQL